MKRRSSLRIKGGTGMLILAAWLILSGLASFVPQLRGFAEFFPIMTLAAGVLILMDR